MNLFDVYNRFDLTISSARGAYVYDVSGQSYLDLYGGHGVVSIGHGHPNYVRAIHEQLARIGFYSNAVKMPIQEDLANSLGLICGYPDHKLFLCNSGTEATENALKLASYHTGKRKVISFKNGFHGRTAAALGATHLKPISARIGQGNFPVDILDLNAPEQLDRALSAEDVCAVIVEGIQGIGGLDEPSVSFLEYLVYKCKKHGALLILDEIQSGFGRSGRFFAHQQASIVPDLITMAKGMGNGFPVAGVLIHPDIEAKANMLGTTFGGNPLACAASLAVLHTIEREQLLFNAERVGQEARTAISEIPAVTKVKGRGLMLGVELAKPIKEIREQLLFKYRIITGASANPNLLRVLPPLNITIQQLGPFISALKTILS